MFTYIHIFSYLSRHTHKKIIKTYCVFMSRNSMINKWKILQELSAQNTHCHKSYILYSSEFEIETIKLVFVSSPVSTQHYGERVKYNWLGIRIMCPSGATCLLADCCFSEWSDMSTRGLLFQ